MGYIDCDESLCSCQQVSCGELADMASVYILTYEIDTLQMDVKFYFEIIFGKNSQRRKIVFIFR